MDQSKKTMRHFYCRDVLWETFEQMAHELECSVDYLVNEAMKQYARQRSHGGTGTHHPSTRPADPLRAHGQRAVDLRIAHDALGRNNPAPLHRLPGGLP